MPSVLLSSGLTTPWPGSSNTQFLAIKWHSNNYRQLHNVNNELFYTYSFQFVSQSILHPRSHGPFHPDARHAHGCNPTITNTRRSYRFEARSMEHVDARFSKGAGQICIVLQAPGATLDRLDPGVLHPVHGWPSVLQRMTKTDNRSLPLRPLTAWQCGVPSGDGEDGFISTGSDVDVVAELRSEIQRREHRDIGSQSEQKVVSFSLLYRGCTILISEPRPMQCTHDIPCQASYPNPRITDSCNPHSL